jgi:hypothetical protein
MKGLWTGSDIEKAAAGAGRSAEETHLLTILRLLREHKGGISNAEFDALLNNSSQWVAMWYIRELLAAEFIEYKAQLFGEPGKYRITDAGTAFLQRLGGDEKADGTARPSKRV